jgi:hypothetical protein
LKSKTCGYGEKNNNFPTLIYNHLTNDGGIQRVWVCHILSDILPLYLSFIKRKRYNIFATKSYYIGENKEGATSRLGIDYIQ